MLLVWFLPRSCSHLLSSSDSNHLCRGHPFFPTWQHWEGPHLFFFLWFYKCFKLWIRCLAGACGTTCWGLNHIFSCVVSWGQCVEKIPSHTLHNARCCDSLAPCVILHTPKPLFLLSFFIFCCCWYVCFPLWLHLFFDGVSNTLLLLCTTPKSPSMHSCG